MNWSEVEWRGALFYERGFATSKGHFISFADESNNAIIKRSLNESKQAFVLCFLHYSFVYVNSNSGL